MEAVPGGAARARAQRAVSGVAAGRGARERRIILFVDAGEVLAWHRRGWGLQAEGGSGREGGRL